MHQKSNELSTINEKPVLKIKKIASAGFPTRHGYFTIYGFEYLENKEPFVVLCQGEFNTEAAPLVRIHSQCLTGDALGSLRCDCKSQLEEALKWINKSGCGLLIYQLQEGRGIGILNKILAYQLQDGGADTVEANNILGFEADLRQYEGCVEILHYFGIRRVRMMSNNPEKIKALENAGIKVEERIPMEFPVNSHVRKYLKTKREKMGHYIEKMNILRED